MTWNADWLKNLFPKDEPAQLSEKQIQISVGTGEGSIDTYSGTWAKVSDWAQSELTKARERNDLLSCDATATAALRGRIKLLKELLSLPLPPKERKKQEISIDEDY